DRPCHARARAARARAHRRSSSARGHFGHTYCRGSDTRPRQSCLPLSQTVRSAAIELDGKVALVTGAASGLGHGIAKRYVEAGGRVAIADLKADGAAAKELGCKKTAIGIGMDVSKEDQVNEGVEQTVKAFGRIDIL